MNKRIALVLIMLVGSILAQTKRPQASAQTMAPQTRFQGDPAGWLFRAIHLGSLTPSIEPGR